MLIACAWLNASKPSRHLRGALRGARGLFSKGNGDGEKGARAIRNPGRLQQQCPGAGWVLRPCWDNVCQVLLQNTSPQPLFL